MTTLKRGTEVQDTPEDIKQILNSHHEILIITTNLNVDSEGEHIIAVFSKLLDNNSIIAPMLANILQNLLATNNGKQCGDVKNKTTIDS